MGLRWACLMGRMGCWGTVNLRIAGYFRLEGSSEGQLAQTRSMVSSVAKVLSVLGVKGRQRRQLPKSEAELLPRGTQAVRAFEPQCPRAETCRVGEAAPMGSFGGQVLSRIGGDPEGLGESKAEGGGGGEPPSPRAPDVPLSPKARRAACSPRLCPPPLLPPGRAVVALAGVRSPSPFPLWGQLTHTSDQFYPS